MGPLHHRAQSWITEDSQVQVVKWGNIRSCILKYWPSLDEMRWQCWATGEWLSVPARGRMGGRPWWVQDPRNKKGEQQSYNFNCKNEAGIMCFKIDGHKWSGLKISKPYVYRAHLAKSKVIRRIKPQQTLLSSIPKTKSHLGLYSRHTNLIFTSHSAGSVKRVIFTLFCCYCHWCFFALLMAVSFPVLSPHPYDLIPSSRCRHVTQNCHQNIMFFWPQWLVQSWVSGPKELRCRKTLLGQQGRRNLLFCTENKWDDIYLELPRKPTLWNTAKKWEKKLGPHSTVGAPESDCTWSRCLQSQLSKPLNSHFLFSQDELVLSSWLRVTTNGEMEAEAKWNKLLSVRGVGWSLDQMCSSARHLPSMQEPRSDAAPHWSGCWGRLPMLWKCPYLRGYREA